MTALAGVSFAVGRGEVFGFLGPNGSGKMSTVRILVTLLRQTSGSGRVGGFDTVREPARVRELIGYAAQATGVDDDLTVHENLALQVLLHRATPAEIKERAEQLVEALGLSELLNQRVGRLSGGCAAASTLRRRSSTGPTFCSWTSRRPGSTRHGEAPSPYYGRRATPRGPAQ